MNDLNRKLAGRPGWTILAKCFGLLRRGRSAGPLFVLGAVLSLGVWGCGTAEQTPAGDPSEPKPPVEAAQSMSAPATGIPIKEFTQFMTSDRGKLAGAGAATLLVTFMVGVGVGRSRKGPAVS